MSVTTEGVPNWLDAGKLGRAQVDEHAGHRVVGAADARKDQDQRADLAGGE